MGRSCNNTISKYPTTQSEVLHAFLNVLVGKVLLTHNLHQDSLLLLGAIQGDLTTDHEEYQGDGQGVEDDFDGKEDGVV